MEATPGSKYASQRRVFNDLGQGVLNNAFQGTLTSFHYKKLRIKFPVERKNYDVLASLCICICTDKFIKLSNLSDYIMSHLLQDD